jgi:hypothetical protein|tara:strand:- start:14024 stop:14656 length:633 start_codon:yes stop_codon:yes gene_type:complete
MPTNPTTSNDRLPKKSGGGNNLKQNFTAIKYGNDHGSIAFGKIHKKADVTSDIMLAASDGEHFMSMDKDGQRTGWTTIMSPGNFQVECGSNREESDDACMINAKNGNIDIIATNGKIRLQATDIELIAVGGSVDKGNIRVSATENFSVDAKKVLLSSKVNTKIASAGITEVVGNSCLKIYGSVIRGVSDACAVKDTKVGGQRYQQQQNQV